MDKDSNIGLSLFQIEIDVSRDIDDKAKYVMTLSAIFIGLIINSTIGLDIPEVATSFSVLIIPLVLFLLSIMLSIMMLISWNTICLPNELIHKSPIVNGENKCKSCEKYETQSCIDTKIERQSENQHYVNAEKLRMLFFSYATFYFGIIFTIYSVSYIFTDWTTSKYIVNIALVVGMAYIIYGFYKKLPSVPKITNIEQNSE